MHKNPLLLRIQFSQLPPLRSGATLSRLTPCSHSTIQLTHYSQKIMKEPCYMCFYSTQELLSIELFCTLPAPISLKRHCFFSASLQGEWPLALESSHQSLSEARGRCNAWEPFFWNATSSMGLKSTFLKRKTSIIEESRIDYFAPKSLNLPQLGPSGSSGIDRVSSGIARPGYGSLQSGNKVGAGILMKLRTSLHKSGIGPFFIIKGSSNIS